MTTFSESDIREAFQTFDRDGNGFIGTAHVAAPAFSSPSRSPLSSAVSVL
jgi:Ca2+-binding EF-hand superfamily protein